MMSFLNPLPHYFESHKNVISPFGIRLHPNLEASDIHLTAIWLHSLLLTPPWLLVRQTIIFSIAYAVPTKQYISPLVYQSLFVELLSPYPTYHQISLTDLNTKIRWLRQPFSFPPPSQLAYPITLPFSRQNYMPFY